MVFEILSSKTQRINIADIRVLVKFKNLRVNTVKFAT